MAASGGLRAGGRGVLPGGLAAFGGLGGLLAALTTLLWRALQPIYFLFSADGIYFSYSYFIFLILLVLGERARSSGFPFILYF